MTTPLADRWRRTRERMDELGIDVLLLSVGPDLPWLTGYEAMPLERLTMLVVPRDGTASLVVPRLEAPRVVERPDLFDVVAWDETADPVALVVNRLGAAATAAIGDRTWARFLVELQQQAPALGFRRASEVLGPLRAVKDAAELSALRAAAAAADRVAGQLQAGDVALLGRTEADVSADLSRRLLAEGHQRVNFAIVAAGENAASPHHDAGRRRITVGDIVLCDFGGTMLSADGVGYCSDITRCVHIGPPSPELSELYAVLHGAQAAGVAAARVGASCEHVDGTAREVITAAGYGPQFIHRTGHGIGVEEHEDPYIVSGNRSPLVAGNVFSVEPGIYLSGRWGARLEDIVVAADSGPERLNHADHSLVVVNG